MRYWWGTETANKGRGGKKEGDKKKRKRERQKQGGEQTRNKRLKQTDKRETGRRVENEQQRGAVSSILAQVGSGPGIFYNPQGVCRCHSLQRALFPVIPPKTPSIKKNRKAELNSSAPLTPLLFSFSVASNLILSFIFHSRACSVTSKLMPHRYSCERKRVCGQVVGGFDPFPVEV